MINGKGIAMNDATAYEEALFSGFYQYMNKKKIYVPERQKKNLGDRWKEMLGEFIGQLTCNKSKGSSINSIYDELCDLFPAICDKDIQNEDDQLIYVFDMLRYARITRKRFEEGRE